MYEKVSSIGFLLGLLGGGGGGGERKNIKIPKLSIYSLISWT